ncbi:bifunctional precorrin-2 dehydrogenase/sirohydrochlorin ferrochelatase [Candidatus Aerophobetes bacterium]|nr:bifunctional precorrin-2 dehydrogenase/sirohydrochlorin ferrochelatase [Candidatus Aerophobetes bacterium]
MKKGGELIHLARKYRKGDLKGSFLAIGATGKQSVNEKIATEARRLGCLVNIVDSPSLCDFFVPSFLRRGDLIISVSTGGKSPALAKKIKKELEKIYTDEYEEFLDWMGKVREEVGNKTKDENKRKKIFQSIVLSGVLDLLKRGQKEKAREHFLKLIQGKLNADKGYRSKP